MIRLIVRSVENSFAALARRDPYVKYAITGYLEHFHGMENASTSRAMEEVKYPREYYKTEQHYITTQYTLDEHRVIKLNDSHAEDDVSAAALILVFFLFCLTLLFDSGMAHYMMRPPFIQAHGWVAQWAYIASIAVCMLAVSLLSMAGAPKAPYLSAAFAFVCLILSAQFIAHIETLTGFHGVAASIAIVAMCIWAYIERRWHRRLILMLAIALAAAIFVHADGFQYIDAFNEIERRRSRRLLVMLYWVIGGLSSIMMAFSMRAFSIMPSPRTRPSIAVATGISALASIMWGLIALMVYYLGKFILVAAWEEIKQKFAGSSRNAG